MDYSSEPCKGYDLLAMIRGRSLYIDDTDHTDAPIRVFGWRPLIFVDTVNLAILRDTRFAAWSSIAKSAIDTKTAILQVLRHCHGDVNFEGRGQFLFEIQ